MAIKLHKDGHENAVRLIKAGEVSTFDADWNEEKPTPDEVVRFINAHFMSEYGLWFLGTDDKFPDNAKEYYIYPYGDLKMVQRCALIDTIKKSQEKNHPEITAAAKQLLEMIDKKSKK